MSKTHEFAYRVSVLVVLTRKELEQLLACAMVHYDCKAQQAARVGGLLWGWRNVLGRRKLLSTYVDFGQLDLCLKILEPHQGELHDRLRDCLTSLRIEDARVNGDG